MQNNADGFYLEAEDLTTLTVSASFNRVINNTNSSVRQAIGAGVNATVGANMENNWWGCNAGPNSAGCGVIVGAGVDFTPWIVLKASASSSTINPGETSLVTTDMTMNSANATPTGTLPDMPVSYSATNGFMTPPTSTVMARMASSVFTSTNALSSIVSTTVDNQTVTTPITVIGPNAITVTPATTPTATDNDYTRINYAVQAIAAGGTITLSGTFDWTEPNAAASWALGSDATANTLDDYSILVPANKDGVIFTASSLGDATIQGPGDLPGLDLEGVFFFNQGQNQNWTISNIRFLDFDLTIGMFDGATGTAFNGTHIMNNYIRVARDVATATDTFQNIGNSSLLRCEPVDLRQHDRPPGRWRERAWELCRRYRAAKQHERRQYLRRLADYQ